jgi:hypothetical protein
MPPLPETDPVHEFPLTVADTRPVKMHIEPTKEAVPVTVAPLCARVADTEPLSTYSSLSHVPDHFPLMLFGTGEGVRVGVTVGRGVAERDGVMLGVGVAVRVEVATQPLSALFTAVRISSTVIWPSSLISPMSQSDTGALPRAMFTIVSSSSTVTCSSLLQSPQHGALICSATNTPRSVPA